MCVCAVFSPSLYLPTYPMTERERERDGCYSTQAEEEEDDDDSFVLLSLASFNELGLIGCWLE